ncbi:hypothetical protein VN12_13745 [Pirellula sp. SH-Sr6A]|uniref:hypothetical protein n=1 Tax=Pirellula sp. SH-Sr6A TaxID=1632865 RepID=UPI00078B6F4E|nr:hypothetical protein [Pirellula sp. SH-Sr6A]AMV33184.1 hypothetical protein VN12_13745 [Pirellula sp. SH-Sr6A]
MPALRLANSIRMLATSGLAVVLACSATQAQGLRPEPEVTIPVGNSTREARDQAIRSLPYPQLTQAASSKIREVVDHASYFRRLPSQSVECDPEMFSFLVRNPEVIVNIWDVMGITRVSLQRLGQYQLAGDDGSGTTCKMDLIFGNDTTHIYHVTGGYKGSMWPKELHGKSVVVLHHKALPASGGVPQMSVTMDVFLKLENLGADLVVRTLGPLVNKSADYNFVECVAFVGQVSQVAVNNPVGLQNLASRLDSVDPRVRDQFVSTAKAMATKYPARGQRPLVIGSTPGGYSVEEVFEVESELVATVVPPPDAILTSSDAASRPISTRKPPSGPNRAEGENREGSSDSPTLQKLRRISP